MDPKIREKIGDSLCDVFRAYLGQSASIRQLERLRVASANLANLISVVCQSEASLICSRLQRVVAEGFKNVDKDMSKIERDMERMEEKMDERLAALEKKAKKLEPNLVEEFEGTLTEVAERRVSIADSEPPKPVTTIKATVKTRKKAAQKRSGRK